MQDAMSSSRLRAAQLRVLQRLLALDTPVREPQLLVRSADCLAAGVATAVVCVAGLLAWERGPWFLPYPHADDWYGADPRSMTGYVLFVTCAASAVTLLYVAANTLLRYSIAYGGGARAVRLSLLLYGALTACFAVTAVAAALTWARAPLRCAVIGCVGARYWTGKVERDHGNNVRLGLMVFVVLYPLAVVMACRALVSYMQLRRLRACCPAHVVTTPTTTTTTSTLPPHMSSTQTDGDATTHPPRRPLASANLLQRVATTAAAACDAAMSLSSRAGARVTMRVYVTPRLRSRVLLVGVSCALLLACGAVSCLLPSGSHDFTTAIIASVAAQRPSANVSNVTSTVPELPHARVLRTRAVRLSELVYLKLFPGNVLFYGYLVVLLLLVSTLRLSQRGRYWLHRRLPTAWCGGASLSVVEAVCLLLTAVLCVLFFYYWLHNHNFKGMWREGMPVRGYMGAAEVWGRALGQLAVLLLSLLLFPISRHSVLFALLGVSWDSLMWLHRVLGYGMLLATLAHVVAFYVQYYEQGVLWHNLNYLPNIVGQRRVRNDFTVPLATWATCLLFVAMGPLSLPYVRRRCFELFYYTHLFASYVLLPVTLWHATAGWQFMLPGLTLWLVDRLIRLYQSGALVTVQRARVVSEDVVELVFAMTWWGRSTLHPGHYVFVNVPELSPLQWHPMTLSNAACAAAAADDADYGGSSHSRHEATCCTMHIKSMGGRSWSARLYRHVAAGRPLTLAVDGPCGTPIDFAHYDTILLVCGGIGVTPCASIFGTLLRQQQQQQQQCAREARQRGRPRCVRLTWMTRSAALVAAMATTLGLPSSLQRCAYAPPRKRTNATARARRAPWLAAAAAATDAAAADRAVDDNNNDDDDDDGDDGASPPRCAHTATATCVRVTVDDNDNNDNDNDERMQHTPESSSSQAPLLFANASPADDADDADGVRVATAAATAAGKHGNDTHDDNDVASVTRRYFECRLFVTDERNYAAVCDAVASGATTSTTTTTTTTASPSSGGDTATATNVTGGTSACAGLVDLSVASGRACIADELDAARVCALRVPELVYNVQRTIVFVCGPESLVRDVTRVCTALGVHMHEETFLL